MAMDAEIQFQQWAQNNGFRWHKGIRIHHFPDTGRGMQAIHRIGPGEKLFECPRQWQINLETSKFGAHLRRFRDLDSWFALAILLMAECSLGEQSQWYPYLRLFPKTLNSLLLWPDTRLRRLQATYLPEIVNKPRLMRIYSSKIEGIAQDLFHYHDLRNDSWISWDIFVWLLSIVMAYSFSTNAGTSMVPCADMLNARTGKNNARLFSSHSDGSMNMEAIVEIIESEEIYNTYGNLSNSELLRRYGFIDDINPYNTVLIPLNQLIQVRKLTLNTIRIAARAKVLRKRGYLVCDKYVALDWPTFSRTCLSSILGHGQYYDRRVHAVLLRILKIKVASFAACLAQTQGDKEPENDVESLDAAEQLYLAQSIICEQISILLAWQRRLSNAENPAELFRKRVSRSDTYKIRFLKSSVA